MRDLIWKKTSDYAIQSGEWTICRVLVGDVPIYTLWRGDNAMGNFNSSDEAKGAAK